MPLAQLPLDCDSHVIADWFEFHILSNEFDYGLLRDLQRAWDRRKNSEGTSPDGREEEPDTDERFLESILEHLRERVKVLGSDYPFEFNDSEEELKLKTSLSKGAVIYLFCLFLSNTQKSEIFELDKFNYDLNGRVRDLFQACSTWATAGEVEGFGIAFGFPRPDHSNFLTKIKECYHLFGEGKVRDEALPAVSLNPKDEGIDVIGWKPRKDGAAGKMYLIGQVASGNNWVDKSVRECIDPFHDNWFTERPASTPVPAMFIPFCIDQHGSATHKQRMEVLTRMYGSVFYRLMIPSLAQKGLDLAENNKDLVIERTSDFAHIEQWVNDLINQLKRIALA